MTEGRRVRVLVADDSRAIRDALTALLGADPRIEVVGQAVDGTTAVSMARQLRPDVVTMDIQMPGLNGLDAVAAIMEDAPCRILVVCAVSEGSQVDLSFRAMSVGALELIAKPTPGANLIAWGERVAQAVCLMAEVPVVTRHAKRRVSAASVTTLGHVDAFAVAASTGGPPALATILHDLPAHFPVPVLIAQHIAPGFASGLIRWFSTVTPLTVVMARSGAAAQPGHVYLPPDNHDLEVTAEGLLRTIPSPGGHCPSANRLLRSVAEAYRARAGGVILTGMGEDGADGLLAIHRAGGVTLAQDEASCSVFGMPQAALKRGAVTKVLELESMAQAMRQLCERPLAHVDPNVVLDGIGRARAAKGSP